jgi:type II secretory pathway pseudopilin PulG
MLRRRDGYTIIEVIVSIMLTAVMVSAVFSVALTTKTGGGKADRKLLAGQAERSLTAALRSYVTADTANTAIPGPNAAANTGGATGAAGWSIHTAAVQTDSMGVGTYALAVGTHILACPAAAGADAACFLAKALRNPPFNGTIQYVVAAGSPPQVTVTVNWTEP